MTKKILLLFVLFTLVFSSSVEQITHDYLEQIKTSKRIWIVYATDDESNSNLQVLHEVSDILSGFFKVGLLSTSENKLYLYSDDSRVVEFTGNFNSEEIINFVLTNTNAVIQSRSKAANDVKANKEFLEKQAARATKQWNDEQQLRKKSDTLVLDVKNWQSAFVKERQGFFINFYEANCSACIQLNREWQSVATSLKGKGRVAKINMTEAQSLQSEIKLSRFPVIRFYPVGTKRLDNFVEFDGIKKKFSILQWANVQLSSQQTIIEIPQLNKQNYKTLCKQSKSTCIIAFVEDPLSVEGSISELASKYLKKPINFLVSKKGSQPEFEKQVGVETAPETVMIYCKGNKMLRMGGMDFKVIDEVINEITLGNRNNFVRFKVDEKLN